jgi:hypothetical protein
VNVLVNRNTSSASVSVAQQRSSTGLGKFLAGRELSRRWPPAIRTGRGQPAHPQARHRRQHPDRHPGRRQRPVGRQHRHPQWTRHHRHRLHAGRGQRHHGQRCSQPDDPERRDQQQHRHRLDPPHHGQRRHRLEAGGRNGAEQRDGQGIGHHAGGQPHRQPERQRQADRWRHLHETGEPHAIRRRLIVGERRKMRSGFSPECCYGATPRDI